MSLCAIQFNAKKASIRLGSMSRAEDAELERLSHSVEAGLTSANDCKAAARKHSGKSCLLCLGHDIALGYALALAPARSQSPPAGPLRVWALEQAQQAAIAASVRRRGYIWASNRTSGPYIVKGGA
eukprot:CAMPEP_0113569940 /NCGR_PEP_ID=MMETSP0015_2-20120614/24689_1 /TAXON_ID=2838 /ORGANISM="Odontella" /LENGTH=125 /DNA_ID=CAMNT_0000472659 /DNA_START=187 /DNA_END=561 /DNA_ORIENTATION=- /assembly_acc=CAM_ASM_000160